MQILYEDSKIVVAVKPCGVLSTDEPGGMPSLVRTALGEGSCVYTVHRLDAAVGGVMVLARTRHAASTLGCSVQEHRFQKEYLAVVRGEIPQGGELRDWLVRDTKERRTYAVPEPRQDAREAVLSYERLGVRDGLSLAHIQLRTGRTHQIRCQFSARGWPLWGDRKYGRAEEGDIALWSYALTFAHPVTGEELHFEKRPPEAMPWELFTEEIP